MKRIDPTKFTVTESGQIIKPQKPSMADKKCLNCVRMSVSQDEYISIMEEQCRDYEEQIERMQCCGNCKKRMLDNEENDICEVDGEKVFGSDKCGEWEMEE